MAGIDFPSSPTTGQTYTYGGVTYVYSAQGVWLVAGSGGGGGTGGAGDTGPTGTGGK